MLTVDPHNSLGPENSVSVERMPQVGLAGQFGDTVDDLAQKLALDSQAGVLTAESFATQLAAAGADRGRLITAYTAAGGNTVTLEAALKLIPSGPSAMTIAYGVLGTASFAASVFHGYRRNRSVGWAIWWGVMGAMFPVITPVIAVAQGFGKPKR